MALARQFCLPTISKARAEHGGELWRGIRKTARPLVTKRPMHFVLRSTLAKGPWSLLHPMHAAFIRTIVPILAKKFGVILYEWSQNSNHLHFLLKAREREGLQRFLMVVCARIAMKVTGARKGRPLGKRFFDTIPFSRIVEWGRAFQAAAAYVRKNVLEAARLIPYERKGKRALAAGPERVMLVGRTFS